jgi:hypothetical protein
MKNPKNRLLPLSVVPVAVLLIVASLTAQSADKAADRDSTAGQMPATSQSPQDSLFAALNAQYQIVKPILGNSCFDCHSRFTVYPWYHKLPLVKSLLDNDIKEARKFLDLSDDFPFKGKGPLDGLLEDIKSEIQDGGMPLWSYRLMHWGKLIEGAKRDSLFRWIDGSLEVIKQQSPAR